MNKLRYSKLVYFLALFALAACQATATSIPESPVPPTVTAPAPTAVPKATLAPTVIPAAQTRFNRPPLAFTYGPEWRAQVGINAVDIIHKGNPPEPQSDWWGPVITLVNGARVADPSDTDKLIPWPDDFFAYLTAFPNVKVIQGPDPVTIGGVQGTQIIVHATSLSPILWLKDDYSWLGGVISDGKIQLILLDANGERVLLMFPDSPEKFDERYPLVQEIFSTITFTK